MASLSIPKLTALRNPAAVEHGVSLSALLADQLHRLYRISERSLHVFGSPLGPLRWAGHSYQIPRFVYFGPHTHDQSLRLALYAGWDQRDLRGTLSLLHFVERLALDSNLGQSLNLSFFPVVDVLGSRATETRHLRTASWNYPDHPEIDLLSKDARIRGYHGFISIQTGQDDEISVALRSAPNPLGEANAVEFISSEDFGPWPVRWEGEPSGFEAVTGPLSLADDLPVEPFELILRIPDKWTPEEHRESVSHVLRRFIQRHRGLLAYGQNL